MDVEKFLVKADQALRKRAAPQAIALYKQVLVASPNHGRARAGLLSAYRRKAELKGGPSMLDKAAAKSLRAAAAGLRGKGQAGALLKTCEAGLEKNPNDPGLAASMAGALATLERPEEALAVWQFRLEFDADDQLALKHAGILHYELRQIHEAIACLDRAHAVDAHDPEVEKLRKNLAAEGTLEATRFETATSSRELIKDKAAMEQSERTQRLHKTADELVAELGELESQLAAAPGNVDARRRLARGRLKSGDPEAARALVAEGLALAPEDDSLQALGGEIDLAVTEQALATAQAAGDAGELERLKAEKGRLEVEEFTRRVARNPGDSAARLRLAKAAYRTGETDTAIENFQAVAGDSRIELEARLGLGACFFRKGLFPLARRQFSLALERAGGVGGDRGKEICYHLGLVCERLGEPQEALDRYMEVYEVDIHFKDVARKVEELSP